MDDVPLCSVCCESLGECGGPATLPCGHSGCLQCLRQLQQRVPHCPLCRADFAGVALRVNIELRTLLQRQLAAQQQQQQGGGGGGGDDVDDGDDDDGWAALPTPATLAAQHARDIARGAAAARGASPWAQLLTGAGDATDGDAADVGGDGRGSVRAPALPTSGPATALQRDVLALEPPPWLPDSCAAACMAAGCNTQFSLRRPRHHCRLCGRVFCHNCSSRLMLLPPRFAQRDPQRVCNLCAALLAPLQPFLVAALAESAQRVVHDVLDGSAPRAWLNAPLGSKMQDELYKAANVLRAFLVGGGGGRGGGGSHVSLMDGALLPAAAAELLANARGLALLSVARVGAGWSATVGSGVVVARCGAPSATAAAAAATTPPGAAAAAAAAAAPARRSSSGAAAGAGAAAWSAPCAVSVWGVGWGLQLGGDLADVLLVFRSDEALQALAGPGGAAAGVGAAAALTLGPLGRGAAAGQLGGAGAGGAGVRGGAVVGYARARGAFAGVAVTGTTLVVRAATNRRFYGRDASARQLLLSGEVPRPPAAALLYEALADLDAALAAAGVVGAAPPAAAGVGAAGEASLSRGGSSGAATAWGGLAGAWRRQQQPATAAAAAAAAVPQPPGRGGCSSSSADAAAGSCSRSAGGGCGAPTASADASAAEEEEEDHLPSAPPLAARQRESGGDDDDAIPEYVLEW